MPKMTLARWLKEYARICRELSIDPEEDMRAARLLQELLKNRKSPSLSKLRSLIKNRQVMIFGAGPSLEKSIASILPQITGSPKRPSSAVTTAPRIHGKDRPALICADGATSALLGNRITPDIVVTDLDGNPKDLVRASKLGSIMLVHAHGDNIPLLKKLVPTLKNVIGTTQTRPIRNIRNFYGFTDGDRCVSLAVHFGARSITLVGMDFGKTQGKYSKGKEKPASARKLKKLEIARRLTQTFLWQAR